MHALCLSFKGVEEDIKWGADLCFTVAGKMFCVTSIDPPHAVSFKVLPEEFDSLANSLQIIPAPYMARNKWISVQQWDRLTDEEWKYYITQSYELIKYKLPKKTQKEIDN